MVNAKIWNDKIKTIEELQKQNYPRQTIKVDIQIISIAVASGCEIIYTNDRKIQKLGESCIKVERIEEVKILIQISLL